MIEDLLVGIGDTLSSIWESIGNFLSGFLEGFLQFILDFILFICSSILWPVDFVIDSLFPDISSALSYVSQAFNYAFNYVGWFFDVLGLESFTITFLVEFIIFRLTLPLQLWVIKLAINIYNKIKF